MGTGLAWFPLKECVPRRRTAGGPVIGAAADSDLFIGRMSSGPLV
jgi:hypothetical protein